MVCRNFLHTKMHDRISNVWWLLPYIIAIVSKQKTLSIRYFHLKPSVDVIKMHFKFKKVNQLRSRQIIARYLTVEWEANMSSSWEDTKWVQTIMLDGGFSLTSHWPWGTRSQEPFGDNFMKPTCRLYFQDVLIFLKSCDAWTYCAVFPCPLSLMYDETLN